MEGCASRTRIRLLLCIPFMHVRKYLREIVETRQSKVTVCLNAQAYVLFLRGGTLSASCADHMGLLYPTRPLGHVRLSTSTMIFRV